MAGSLPAGAEVTLVIGGSTGSWLPYNTLSPDQIKAGVAARLALEFQINQFTIATPGALDRILQLGGYAYVATLDLSCRLNEPDGEASILSEVQAAFADIAQSAPDSAAVTAIQLPGQAVQRRTGPAPNPDTPGAGGFADMLAKFWAGLTSTIQWIVIGLAVLILAIVAFVAFGPNVPALARAAA